MSTRTLVTYFSATGNTAGVARRMAEGIGADLYEIRPKEPYTERDLDWTNKKSRSTVEMNDEGSRPELAEAVPDVSGYDTILLGFPVWWYVEPRIVDTFLDGAAIEGKRIVAFATSGGSDVAKCVSHMRSNYPNAEWGQGKLLNSGDPVAWAKSVTE